jgi:hypothetical protein
MTKTEQFFALFLNKDEENFQKHALVQKHSILKTRVLQEEV